MHHDTIAAETIESWREQTSICFINLALVRDTLTSKSVPETEDCVFNSNA